MEITSIHQFGELLKEKKLLKSAAEIGVAEGRTSLQFMNWGFEKLYLVDPWKQLDQLGDGNMPDTWHEKNLRDCIKRLYHFGKKVVYLRGLSKDVSKDVPKSSLTFVYIDGDHSYNGVKTDIKAWLPKLKKGGIMAFHDYNDNYGVKVALDEFVEANGIELHILPEQSIDNQGAWFIKK